MGDLDKVRWSLPKSDIDSSNQGLVMKIVNEAVSSAQSRLLPQGKRFAELAGQNSDTKLNGAIESVVREVQAGE